MSDADGKPQKKKDQRSDAALSEDIQRLRGELAETLDSLEYKLDVPARFGERLAEVKGRVLEAWDEKPLVVAAAGVGALCAIGAVVVGGVALFRRATRGH